jgi:Spy/CpxP family protein refolding chaperone
MMAGLQLTPQQRKKIFDLRAAMIRKHAAARAEVAVKSGELKLLWLADEPNRQQILAKHAEIDGLRKQLRESKIDFRLNALKILTPQQREAIKHMGGLGMGGMRGHMRKHMKGFMGGRGGMGGGMGGFGMMEPDDDAGAGHGLMADLGGDDDDPEI